MLKGIIPMMCDTVARGVGGGYLPDLGPPYDDAASFVLGCLDAMPRAMAFGLRFATFVFLCSGIFYGGRSFSANPPQARAAQWARWRTHRLEPFRDFVRFYESLIVMTLYSRPVPAGKVA
jgi:hypothetical protein